MNAGEKISKTGSTGLILCLAALVLLFTLLGVRLGTASPIHAQAMTPSISISPPSGQAGTTVNVSGSGIVDNTNTPLASGTVTFGYSSSSDSTCSSASYVGSGSNTTWPTAGS